MSARDTATGRVVTLARESSAWGRLRAGFRSRAVAHVRGGPMIPLGEYRANSPRLAVRWVRKRAEQVADQLDAPYARPVRAWLDDADELEWALQFVTAGGPYVFMTMDDQGTRYVFTVEAVGSSIEVAA